MEFVPSDEGQTPNLKNSFRAEVASPGQNSAYGAARQNDRDVGDADEGWAPS